jgi:Domain of unknown function (DUF4304)
MPPSGFVQRLNSIQSGVHSYLRPLGFRKKGRTHNRRTPGGLVQVVNFQMGAYPIGDYVIPGFRESFYGKFAVNLGILLPCVYEIERTVVPADFVQEYHCTIRDRLESLAYGTDEWFGIADETTSLERALLDLFDKCGLPFLERFSTYEDVLSYYDMHGKLPDQNPGRASLEVAIVAHHRGQLGLSASLFAKAYDSDHVGFRQYVAEISARLGYTVG